MLRFSVMCQFFLRRGKKSPFNLELKERLQLIGSIDNLKVISIDRRVYLVLLYSMANQSLAMAHGIAFTMSGLLRITRWYPRFNPNNHTQTSTLVWVTFFYLPLDFRKEHTLFNIARGMGMTLKIDPEALGLYHGIFGRVLLEIDCSYPSPCRILVQKKNKEN